MDKSPRGILQRAPRDCFFYERRQKKMVGIAGLEPMSPALSIGSSLSTVYAPLGGVEMAGKRHKPG